MSQELDAGAQRRLLGELRALREFLRDDAAEGDAAGASDGSPGNVAPGPVPPGNKVLGDEAPDGGTLGDAEPPLLDDVVEDVELMAHAPDDDADDADADAGVAYPFAAGALGVEALEDEDALGEDDAHGDDDSGDYDHDDYDYDYDYDGDGDGDGDGDDSFADEDDADDMDEFDGEPGSWAPGDDEFARMAGEHDTDWAQFVDQVFAQTGGLDVGQGGAPRSTRPTADDDHVLLAELTRRLDERLAALRATMLGEIQDMLQRRRTRR